MPFTASVTPPLYSTCSCEPGSRPVTVHLKSASLDAATADPTPTARSATSAAALTIVNFLNTPILVLLLVPTPGPRGNAETIDSGNRRRPSRPAPGCTDRSTGVSAVDRCDGRSG